VFDQLDENGVNEQEIFEYFQYIRKGDKPYSRALCSMCTPPHPIAIKAHQLFIETNLGDPGLFQGTAMLERRLIEMLGSLLGKSDAVGYITTGGTESNIQALRAFRNLSKQKNPNVIVPSSAHFSFDKAANVLNIEIRKAALDSKLRVNIEAIRKLIDKNTIALVGVAGTTEFGQIDPIKELAELAIEKDLFLHVDAAFGGLVIPFLEEHYDFDFSIEGVSSITVDPHKMGMSTIPSGCLLFRDQESLRALEIATPYLLAKKQHSLTGTRTGATVASAYAVLKHLGKNGLGKIVRRCIASTRKFTAEISNFRLGERYPAKPIIEPVMNLVVVKVPNIGGVIQRLYSLNWYVSVTRDPVGMRLVIMPHVTDEVLQEFTQDLKKVLEDICQEHKRWKRIYYGAI
jgi:tyrosine decarboxylase/aspartate 1-decarboxylase